MCGRYGSWSAGPVLAEAFGASPAPECDALPPSWNLAPGSDVRVVVERAAAGAPGRTRRELRAARWGLLPSWAKDPRRGARAFNARSETAASRPTFREAMRSFRIVLPADCYYEWLADGARKRPFAVSAADGGPLALAGLASWWRVPVAGPGGAGGPSGLGGSGRAARGRATTSGSPGDVGVPSAGVRPGAALHRHDGALWLLTCTVLTRQAGEDLAWLHHREPVVLDRREVAAWLDPDMRDGAAAARLLGAPHPELVWHEVGPEVGSTRSEGPQLAAPLAPGGPVTS
ncbi:SOS response-associated peptidase [Actinomyces sp. oral taxon 897]|uniref:SOS response-associated peptidase n=1 Tax=Actinomyces sp. oral taxon 897 TaxID=2081702 RepID=UPI000D02E14F|nr:SOS response-associated peptidase [Actinomyces sp. oral taxon 897]AVM62706.1 hypothetical protein C3V41_12545 [Actinomyces sp. oral taxon 897]